MLKYGDRASLEALVNSVTPTGVDLKLIPHSTAHMLDRGLSGDFRFSRGLGEDVYFWTDDTRFKVESINLNSRLLSASRIPSWLRRGDLVSLWGSAPTAVEDLDVTGTQMVVAEVPESVIDAPFVMIHSVRVEQSSGMATPTLLVLQSGFRILPGDEVLTSSLAVSGVLVTAVDRVGTSDVYEVELDRAIEDRGSGAIWYLKCRPAYVSRKLKVPDVGPCWIGMFMGGALTADSEPTSNWSEFQGYDADAETVIGEVSEGSIVVLGDISPTMLAAGKAVEGRVLPAFQAVCLRPDPESSTACLVIPLVTPWPAGRWVSSFRSDSNGVLRLRFRPSDAWTEIDIHGAHSVSFDSPDGASVIEMAWCPEDSSSDGLMTSWNVSSAPTYVSSAQAVCLGNGGTAWAGFGPVARKLLADIRDLNTVATPATDVGMIALELE